MSIVKIPKKVQGILAAIRNGQVADGLAALAASKGLEPQKALVRAEINYFQGRYEEALSCDEQALPYDEQWYAGNILTEHLFAYSQAAIISHNETRAERFLTSFLAAKRQVNLPDHRIRFYEHQITQHIRKLHGEKNLRLDPEPLPLIEVGRPLTDFTSQLQQYRPKLTLASATGADYLLHFLFKQAATEEALQYYATYASQLRTEDHHLTAARLYANLHRPEQARQAILLFATLAWFPVEFVQVAPMRLWQFEDLQPILTPELKEEILALPKGR